ATDLAKNTTTREVSSVAPTTTAAAAGMSPTPSAPPVPAISTAPPPVPVDVASGHTDSRAEKVAAPSQGPDLVNSERPPTAASPVGRDPGVRPAAFQPSLVTQHGPTPAPREAGPGNKQLVNQLHAVLDYRIDQIGPSGVRKVEVWLTADEGKTWQRLCEDPDRRSPVEFELPREGTYGVCLVVTNGNGPGAPAP